MNVDLYLEAKKKLADSETEMAGLSMLRQLAEDGDTRAMCDYGKLFDTPGAPVTQNGEEAFKWYLQAAEYGDDRGQFYVGESYYHGRIVEQDLIQASKWFTSESGTVTFDLFSYTSMDSVSWSSILGLQTTVLLIGSWTFL